MKVFTVVSASMVICVALGVYGWLAVHHIDTTQFLVFFGTAVGPTVGIIYNNTMTKKVSDKVDTIEKQTNGMLHEPLAHLQATMDDVRNVVTDNKENPA